MWSLLDQVNGEEFLFLINWRFSDENQKNAAHFWRRVKHFSEIIFVTGYYSQLILFLGTMPRLWPGFISVQNTRRDKILLVLIFFFKVPISLDTDIGMLYNSTNRR